MTSPTLRELDHLKQTINRYYNALMEKARTQHERDIFALRLHDQLRNVDGTIKLIKLHSKH